MGEGRLTHTHRQKKIKVENEGGRDNYMMKTIMGKLWHRQIHVNTI